MKLFSGIFLERLNRFVVKVKIEEKIVHAYLPNPGRLWELLLPGRTLLLSPSQGKTYSYTVIACLKKDFPVLLHTHLTNHYIAELIEKGKIGHFERYRVLQKEPKVKGGRLDLLLEDKDSMKKFYLEIKTCTLFGEKLAMFPDAETKRGTRHLYELLKLKEEGYETGCLFVVMSPEVKYFLPAYHIDFDFTRAFLETFEKVKYLAFSVRFSQDLETIEEVKELIIPIEFLKREFQNKGAYLLILEMKEAKTLEIGGLGKRFFERGYYVYVGSGRKNLKERVERYHRKVVKKRWHIDYLLEAASLFKSIPILSSEDLECEIARELKRLSQRVIKDFGSSDCKCEGHLFYFKENPLYIEAFVELINYYRLEVPAKRLEDFTPL